MEEFRTNYFVFVLEIYSPQDPSARNGQKILTKCEYKISDGKYIFNDIQILQKDPNFPTPFSISPKFFEFDADSDIMLPFDITTDEAARIYFTLKYCI